MPPATAGRHIERIHVVILFGLATIVLFADAGIKELHGTSVFYASLVREIVDTGSWMGIYTDARAYLLKPPLVIWSSALSSEVFGLTNFGVTFVSRVAGIGCVLLTYVLFRRWWSHPVAWLAAFVMLTNSTFVQFTATLRMDSMLMFGLLLSLVGWAYRHAAWGAAALFGGVTIGVLSKGPLGFGAIPLVALHAMLLGIPPVRAGGWRWSVLLLPVLAWYGLLVVLHGAKPLTELGVDALRASATPDFNLWQSVYAEYISKPFRRYWPWLPLFLLGTGICVVRTLRPRGEPAMRKHYLMVGAWLSGVLATAIVKPDHDIRYMYLGLPVFGLFTAVALMSICRERFASWVPAVLLVVVAAAALAHAVIGRDARDTRAEIAAIRKAVSDTPQTLAIGGYPVPPQRPRRQNTHRDWVYFYTATVPEVLSWRQVRERNVDFSKGVFLTNSRGYEKRLEEFGLVAKYTTTEMVYAVPK